MKLFSKILLILIGIHVLFLAKFLLFHNFFQQDEWHGFGLILSLKEQYVFMYKSPLELLMGDRIGARAITYTIFNLFKLNPLPYGLLALLYQAINAFLVYRLGKQLTRQTATSLLASLLFLVNEVGSEAYTWFGTMNGTALSLTFVLTSILFYLSYVQQLKKYYYLLLSLVFLWVSFLFKEVGSFLFLLYPIVYYLYNKSAFNIRTFLKTHIPFFILALIIISFLVKSVLFIPGDRANYVETGHSFLQTLVLRTVQYPFEGLTQTMVPNEILFKLSYPLTSIISPSLTPETTDFDIAAQTTNAEIIILVLSILFATAAIFTFIALKKDKALLRAFIFSVAMALLSFLPYLVLNRSFSYFDSRYYYVSTAPIAIIISLILVNAMRYSNTVRKVVLLLLITGYVGMHEMVLFSDLTLLSQRADERQLFLKQVQNLVPKLNKRTIFYMTSDSAGYYGLEELKVPFQSGPGHVLMVLYSVNNQLSSDFFKEKELQTALDVGFLYDIVGQGYRQIGEQGFGYYYDKSELQKALGQKLFSEKDIIALYYDSAHQKLEKITYEK